MSFAARKQVEPQTEVTTGGRLVTVDGRALPLTGAALKADAKGGLMRVTLEQTFRNPHEEPLKVTYTLPLPADGAVSGFAFRIGEERAVGQVDTRQRARQRFEDAILEGRTAAILDQERTSLFTQEVGNVPPRTEVVCEVQLDQRLTWLPDGAWEWRFPTVVAPRYLGAAGRVADHAQVTVTVTEDELPVRLSLGLSIRDRLPDGGRPESPSHALHSGRGVGRTDVTFADERGPSLDRDVVVRWKVATLAVGTELDVARPPGGVTSDAAYGLLTVVPPSPEAKATPLPRDLIVLLDTSGSMSGAPIDQARRVTQALVDTLRDRDQLELIEFSTSPRRWKSGPVAATEANRRDAQAWLARLRASGGTEMRSGIFEALRPLRAESQRQVILITDGLIGFESEVLEEISQRLPRGSRVHTVGVGSGVNRSLTSPAARAGRGVELVIGLNEDVEPFVKRLLARTSAPLLTDVEVSGSALSAAACPRLPDLYGGAPALIPLRLRPEGGTLIVTARSDEGTVEERLEVKPVERGEGSPALAALFARESVEELELALATGGSKRDLEPSIERLGLEFQISTRLTSWVAVSARQTVDPRAPRREETMPHALAYGLSAEGVGLRQAAGPMGGAGAAMPMQAQARTRSGLVPASPAPLREAGRMAKSVSTEAMKDRKADVASRDDGFAEDADAPMAGEREEAEAAPADMGGAPPAPPAGPPPSPVGAPRRPEPKKKEGLVDFARRLLKPKPAPAPESQAAPAEKKEQAERQATPARKVRGRIVRRANGKLFLEFHVEGAPLRWAPGPEARLELGDGTMVRAPVRVDQTTADGTRAPGLIITLVLEIDDRVGTPSAVHLANGGEVLEIVL